MRKVEFIGIVLFLFIGAALMVACDNEPQLFTANDAQVDSATTELAPAGVGVTWIDWFGEDGEDLCGGEFIIRANTLSPAPSYNWIYGKLTAETCGGTTIATAITMYDYGVVPRTKYRSSILNINDYTVESTVATKASWFITGTGWDSGGCNAFQSVAVVECPPDTTGGGKGPPNPWED